MSNITREQFASAVDAAISSVYHLYREVDRLIVGLRDTLAEEPSPLAAMRGTSGKSGRDPTRLVMRNEYGTLFGPVIADEDVDDDQDDLEEETEDEPEVDAEAEDGAQGRRKRSPVEIMADQPLLAVLVTLYDPQKQVSFEPQIKYGVMNDWTVGDQASKPGQTILLVGRYMLRRIPRALAASGGVAKSKRLPTRATAKRGAGEKKGAKKGHDRRLSCRLPMGVETVPLYSLDNAEELDRLAKSMKRMWANASKPDRAGA